MRKHVRLALVAVLLAGCASPSETSAPPPSTTAPTVPSLAPVTAQPTTQPTVAISQQTPRWHSVGPTTGLQDVTSLNVAGWFKDRWVVFGSATTGSATWWSINGIDWHLGDVQPAGSVASVVHISAFATNGDVAVAVGSWNERSSGDIVSLPVADSGSGAGSVSFAVGSGEAPRVVTAATCEGLAGADAAVLTSTDGATWARVPDSRALRGQPMLGVVARYGGFVAAGGADGSGRSATWTSPDGRHWTRGPDSAALHAGWISDLAVLGSSVIAVGGSSCGNLGSVPRAWRSADGRSWALASGLIAGSCCGAAEHVAVAGAVAVCDGWVSTPDSGASSSVTWSSGDGAQWMLHPLANQPDFSPTQRIVATPDGFITAGAGVWASTDGVTWTASVSPQMQFGAVAIGPGGALAVGSDIWAGPARAQQ